MAGSIRVPGGTLEHMGTAVSSVPGAGLCNTCRHQRVVATTRGSRFSLCERSRSDPAYVRYPRLPVRECPGYEAGRRAEG